MKLISPRVVFLRTVLHSVEDSCEFHNVKDRNCGVSTVYQCSIGQCYLCHVRLSGFDGGCVLDVRVSNDNSPIIH